MEKKKDISIEWMKFVAALLIVNSHIGVCYGRYEALATGGAIGNALFFFCSGYTLSLGRFDRFDNWMKRRIFRLYPSIIAKSLIGSLAGIITVLVSSSLSDKWGGVSVLSMIAHGGGWFAEAILLFYIVDYMLKKAFNNRLFIPLIVLSLACLGLYVYLSKTMYVDLYGAESKFSCFVYFLIMLLGMCIGTSTKEGKSVPKYKVGFSAVVLCLTVVLYYGSLFILRRLEMQKVEIASVIPLAIMVVSFMVLFKNNIFEDLWNGRYGIAFKFISSHCWEIYLAQLFFCFTYDNHFDRVFPFPLNIPMTFLAIFATGYAIKVCSRFIIQLFNKDNFNWNHIICTWK